MDFKVVLTSVQIEHMFKYLPVTKFKSKNLEFVAKFRLEGACYCYTSQERSNFAQKYIMQWMDDNLLHPHDIVCGYEGSWGSVHKINFMVFFEDEGDAILFFMKYK